MGSNACPCKLCNLYLQNIGLLQHLYISKSVFHWQFIITYAFFVSLKFRACYIKGQWGRVQSTQCNSLLTQIFFPFFFFLFLFFFCCFSIKENCVFIIFFSFFAEASNFRNKILTNQKSELISNCQWNCMVMYIYKKHILA